MADVEACCGRSGWMSVSKLALNSAGRVVEHLIVAAKADDGPVLDEETIDRLFELPARACEDGGEPPMAELNALQTTLKGRQIEKAEGDNSRWLGEEQDKLDRYADDLENAADETIKRLTREVKDRRKAMRTSATLTAQDKIDETRAIKKIEGQIDDLKFETYQRKKAIRKEVEDMLDALQANLALKPSLEPIFTLRWSLHG